MSRENISVGESGRMALDFERPFAYQPPSPTLTNPDMILPDHLPLLPQRMNPTAHLVESWREAKPTYETTARAIENFAKTHGAFVASGPLSPSIMVRPSSPLAAIQEVDTTPRKPFNNATLASSPTYQHGASLADPADWAIPKPRRLSNASSSVHSDDLDNIKWPGHETVAETEENVLLDEEEEEKFGYFPKPVESDDETETDPWLGPREEPDDQDLLSRRADLILANAKKRLNLMEGNLKGARHSLQPKPPGYPPRQSYTRQSLSPRGGTPGHSRAASEASVHSPAPAMPAPHPPTVLPKRASSALGSFAGGLNLLGRTTSLRAARSQEVMRESRLQTWILDDQSHDVSFEPPRSASSIDHHRPTHSRTPSSESLVSSKRPGSRTSEIRAQMDQLKGKISEIKLRASETSSKRGSTLSLRTPSPSVTSVSSGRRYLGTEHRSSPLSPVFPPDATDANSTTSRGSPLVAKPSARGYHGGSSTNGTMTEYAESYYEDAEETLDDLEDELESAKASSGLGIYSPTSSGGYDEDLMEDEVDDGESESQSTSGQTEFFEVAERHEDRADAFDYENFFLHSAMGTYSRDRRRDSFSSEGSVETTRPASPLRNGAVESGESSPKEDLDDSRPSLHRRSQSVDSLLTAATFETAVEEYDDEYDETDNSTDEELEAVTRHFMTSVSPLADITIPSPTRFSRMSLASFPSPSELPPSPPIDAAAAARQHPSSSRLSGQRPLSASHRLSSHRPSSALIGSFIGLDSMATSPDIVQKDRVLVEGVVQALQRCCLQLQRAPETGAGGMREMWREKLVEAMKVLDVAEGHR